MERTILHIDLDAFYPSVEVLDRPELAGKPVIVGGLGRRGVVASASYEARRYGVHSALPMSRARNLCPQGVFLPPRFDRYRELSRQVFDIYRRWTDKVEPLALDEAYLDVTQRRRSGEELARRIKGEILDLTGLSGSAGVACNKYLAKLASDREKPDGLTVISADQACAFLAPLPVEDLWGVGAATGKLLRDAGYSTIGEIAAAAVAELEPILGRATGRLMELAKGLDDRSVEPPGQPKSLSSEITFEEDIVSWKQAGPHLHRFAERLQESMHRRHLWARTVTLKIRYRDFRTRTRSSTPGHTLKDATKILDVARVLASKLPLDAGHPARLVGLGVSNIVDCETPSSSTPDGDSQLVLFPSQDLERS